VGFICHHLLPHAWSWEKIGVDFYL
jgi:hypothetical protein